MCGFYEIVFLTGSTPRFPARRTLAAPLPVPGRPTVHTLQETDPDSDGERAGLPDGS